MKYIIEKALSSDIPSLKAFQVAMALETEDLNLSPEVVGNGISHLFNHPDVGEYYVARYNGEVVACLLTLYEWSDWRNANVLWIHSVYVVPAHRKNGVFAMFYDFLRKKVEEAYPSLAGLRLYVDKTNTTARKVYEKVGMNSQHYEMFEWMVNY